MLTWSTAAPALGAAFLASTVEVVEAFTIVLAVATLRGWRPAALGAGAALALLAAAVLLLGPLLGSVPIHALQLAIGVLLLVFGMSWLRKACLRHAGVIPLHDEDAIFVAQTAQFGEAAQRHQARLDWIAGITALKGVLLEGLEVVFIVIAVGAGGGLLLPASLGALLACALVLLIGAFFGDARMTLAVLLIVVAAGGLVPLTGIDPLVGGSVLALGCPMLLIANLRRSKAAVLHP